LEKTDPGQPKAKPLTASHIGVLHDAPLQETSGAGNEKYFNWGGRSTCKLTAVVLTEPINSRMVGHPEITNLSGAKF
jgi:hypothetical protein